MTNKTFLILFSLILFSCGHYPKTEYRIIEKEVIIDTIINNTSNNFIINSGKIKNSNIESGKTYVKKSIIGLEIITQYKYSDPNFRHIKIFIPEDKLSDKQRVIYDSVKTVIGL